MGKSTDDPGGATLGSLAPPTAPEEPRIAPLDVSLLVILGLLWGSAYIFIKQGIDLGASPLLFASVRYGLSAVAFAAIAVARREAFPSLRNWGISALVGGLLFIGLYGGFLYWGEQYTTGGYAAVLSSTAPILTVVVAFFVLPVERLGRLSLAGLVIGFAGVIVLVAPELSGGVGSGWQGPVFIVAAFLASALGSVFLRRFGGGRQGLWQIGSQFAVGGLFLGLAALVLPFPEALPPVPGVWVALGSLVVFSSVIGYFTYFTLHHRVGPVRANLVAYLIPLVGIGIGTGFFGEPLSLWEVIGFFVVIVGVTLILRESSRPRH